MSFEERIDQVLRASEAVKLVVLVWGPGADAGDGFEKRKKIREEILSRFKNADIRFSEDLEGVVPELKDANMQDQELVHLASCDLCVVLDTSKGAGEEIAHFIRSPFSRKLLILTHEKYQGVTSFPASLRSYGNQIFYSEDEYYTCNLVGRVINHVRLVAFKKISGLFI